MDPASAATLFSTAGGASSAQATMLAAQTAEFGLAGTALTQQALMAGMAPTMSLGSLMSGASLGLNVLSGVQAAGAARTAAAQEAEGLKAQAFQESLKANEESILRRERLLKAISSQAAAAGAGGAAGGSAQALQLESIAAFEREQRSADIMQQTREDIYKRRVAGTLEGGRQAARGELLTTATKLAEIG
jgi:hypothetical protein